MSMEFEAHVGMNPALSNEPIKESQTMSITLK
jgi:hypothetical protein